MSEPHMGPREQPGSPEQLVNAAMNALGPTSESSLGKARDELKAYVHKMLESGMSMKTPPELKNFFNTAQNDTFHKLRDTGGNFITDALIDFLNIFMTGFAQFSQGIGYIMSQEELAREYGTQEGKKSVPITLLTPEEAIQSWFRGLINEHVVNDQLERAGYSSNKIGVLKGLAAELITVSDLAVLANRGTFTDAEYKNYLHMYGYSHEDINSIDTLRKSYLSASEARIALYKGVITEQEYEELLAYEGYSKDQAAKFRDAVLEYPSPVESLINARHGAFSDTMAERWGLDYEMPDIWVEWMHKNGYSKEVARSFWRGHWSPATNGELANLFRRRLIDSKLFREGLTLNGVAQGWHDYVEESAFEYPSYYVIEAMVGVSKPDIEKVIKWCKLAGYPDDLVKDIANGFIKKYEKKSLSESKAQIRKVAQVNGLTHSETYKAFLDIGLTKDEAEIEMQYIQMHIEEETARKEIELVQKQYVEGVMSKEAAVKQLILFGIGSQEIDYWFGQWDLEKKARVKTLTEAQVGHLLKKGHIKTADAMKRWENMGYNETDAHLLTLYYE